MTGQGRRFIIRPAIRPCLPFCQVSAMLNPDDLEPPVAAAKPKGILQPLSIGELRDYIASLETEITRARAMIAKEAHKSGVEGLFRV